jgi:hypothetical protein
MIHMLHKNRTMVYFYDKEKYFSRYSTFYFDRTRPDKRTSLYNINFWLRLIKTLGLPRFEPAQNSLRFICQIMEISAFVLKKLSK